jgi:phenylpropionate dioxygenase-like ring-hydroxylating dioxygenase large terminal subunit
MPHGFLPAELYGCPTVAARECAHWGERFWHPLLPESLLGEGQVRALELLDVPLLLTHSPDGGPRAFMNRCPHRGVALMEPSDRSLACKRLICPYHGWTYDSSGKCVRIPQIADGSIPANAKVDAFRCVEKYGYAWVALEEPLRPIPHFPEDGAPGYRRIFQFHQEWKTSPLRMMENSFDNAHFSFVHKANFGLPDQPKPAPYEFIETDYGFEAETRVPIRNPEASFRITGTTDPVTERHLVNRYFLPFCRRFGCHYSASGIDHIIYNCATPIDDERMILVQWLYRNDSEQACPTQALIDWDATITAEDRDILEATDPDACIDTRRRVEFHMPSDKPGLLIRKQLLDLLHAHGEEEVHRGS